jgi:hypothetical protein
MWPEGRTLLKWNLDGSDGRVYIYKMAYCDFFTAF